MIYEGLMDDLQKKMTRVGNKCRKYGIDFTFELTGNEEIREVKDDSGVAHSLRYVEVMAEGKAQMEDWMFLATVEHTPKGNIIRSVTDLDVPTKYYTSSPVCEHCRSNRIRKDTFLVRHTLTGEIKQVGKSCLKDFTHGMNADGIASMMSYLTGLEEAEEWIPSSGLYFPEYFTVEEIARYTAETIRHYGYVRRGTWEDGRRVDSTFDRATDFYEASKGHTGHFFPDNDRYYKVLDEMKACGFNPESEEAVNQTREALKWVEEVDDSKSTYLHNLKVTCSLNEVTWKHLGIICSLFPAWNKDLEKQEERKAKVEADSVSNYVGNIGERIQFDVKSVRILTSWDTDWGTTWLLKIVDTEGNIYTWKSSGNFPDDVSTIQKVIGTVKNHSDYKGVKQTELTRCKVSA